MNTRRILVFLACLMALLALPVWTCAAPTAIRQVFMQEATAYNNARRIVVDADGHVHIVFQEDAGAIIYGYHDELGWHFENPGLYSSPYYYPAIAVDDLGNAFIVAIKGVEGGYEQVVVIDNVEGPWNEVCQHTVPPTEDLYDPSIEIWSGETEPYVWRICWVGVDRSVWPTGEWSWSYQRKGDDREGPFFPTSDLRGIHDLSMDLDSDGRVHVSLLYPLSPWEEPWIFHYYKDTDGSWVPGGTPAVAPPAENACIDWDGWQGAPSYLVHALYERHGAVNRVEHNGWDYYEWGEPVWVRENTERFNYPVIDDGRALWQDEVGCSEPKKWSIYYSSFDYGSSPSWSQPEIISDTKSDNWYPQIVYEDFPEWDGPDALHMIWTRNRLGRLDIMYNSRWVYREPPWRYADLGKAVQSPYCRHRDGYIEYGDEGCLSIDYGYSNLVYFFDGLDSTEQYWLEVSSYHETGTEVVELIEVDGDTLDSCTVSPCQPEYVLLEIPPDAVLDKEIEVRILRQQGALAVTGILKLYAEGYLGGEGTACGPQVLTVKRHRSAGFLGLSARPNPFCASTTVELDLPQQCVGAVEVYDISGRLVKSLASGVLDAGMHRFVWNGENDSGSDVPSGVYVCRGNFQDRVKATKVVLAR